jgi:tetratricopeptide (TPR) repeat protein
MFKKYLLFLFLFILSSKQLIFSQNYLFKKEFSTNDKKEFLGITKKIFGIDNQISYNLSSFDAQAKFTDISDPIKYNDAFLQKIRIKLSKDSLNSNTLNDFGNYYTNKGNKSLAKQYFKKALDNLSLKNLPRKDSAFYYSFRGILKSNLETEGAITDVEKALKINPNDSIAIAFYPMFLIQKGRYSESKKICTDALEKKPDFPLASFAFLNMTILFESLNESMDDSKKEANSKKNYDELLDLKTIYKYANLYKNNNQVQNLKRMSEIIGLFVKMQLFDYNENNEILFNFNENEINKIHELEKEFKELLVKGKINSFTGNKSLCILNFMMNNKDKSIDYAKKAIAVFPNSKKTNQFGEDESYALLLSLYQLKEDDVNYKKALEEKISKSSEFEKSINDYIKMGYLYLYENDLIESEEWCKKAREIDPDDFEALSLLAHLKSINNQLTLGQFYLEEASKHIKNDNDNYIFSLRSTIYMMLYGNNNDAKSTFDNIEICRKMMQKKCTICDELIEKYIQINP